MFELMPVNISFLYGAAYFIMGFAIVVRTSAFPSSGFRNRLFALGAFGLIRAASIWAVLVYDLPRGDPFGFREVVHLPAYFALFYFAFGWNEKRPMLAHAIALTAIGCLAIMFLFAADSLQMQIGRRVIIVMPATACAALVFLRDSSFQFPSTFSTGMRWLVALGFLVYSGLSLIFRPGDFFPASILNTDNFEALTGLTILSIRSTAIIVITVAILALLNSFSVALRRQSKQALATADKKLKKALDIIRLGNWEWNAETGESSQSDNFCEILGVTREELKPGLDGYLESVHPDDRTAVENTIRQAVERQTPYKISHRILRPDGAVRYVQSHGEVECGTDDEAPKLLGVLHDVTELTEAKIAAEDASAAKSNFIANISHELRTPLNAILGFSEIMKLQAYGPLGNAQYASYAEDIHRSGQHLLSIINDILSISRLESGNMKLHDEGNIDVKELLKSCTSWVQGQATEAGIKLRTSIAPSVTALKGDSRLLTQILLNLLSNAVKFTHKGGSVELSANAADTGAITIAVKDTGIGMTTDQIARIGERFLQFDNTLERKYTGTGIGLSLVKRMVELHGGELEIESALNEGTTVSIHMPPERCVPPTSSRTEAA